MYFDSVRVDYNQSLTEMIKAGNYDICESPCTLTPEMFRVQGKGVHEVELVLVNLDKRVTSANVMAEIKKQGLRPADVAELLTFGAKYPDVQKDFQIVELGSVWASPHGDCVLGLDSIWGGLRRCWRRLMLCQYWPVWSADCWFLAAYA